MSKINSPLTPLQLPTKSPLTPHPRHSPGRLQAENKLGANIGKERKILKLAIIYNGN
jgi:hypothetical protein